MTTTIVQVDAFTSRACGGNPAGVCVLPAPREGAWMPVTVLRGELLH